MNELSPTHQAVVHAFAQIAAVQTIWVGGTARSIYLLYVGTRGLDLLTLQAQLAEAREELVERAEIHELPGLGREAWTYATSYDTPDTTGYTRLWARHSLADARAALLKACADLPDIVDVTVSQHEAHGVCATLVVRTKASEFNSPSPTLPALVSRATDSVRATFYELGEMQLAPELNFPPAGCLDEDEPWFELKGALIRELEKRALVIAAWFRAHPDPRRPELWVFGEDDELLQRAVQRLGVDFRVVGNDVPRDVPREAQCIFNKVTRLIKAQIEGDAAQAETMRASLDKDVRSTRRPVATKQPFLSALTPTPPRTMEDLVKDVVSARPVSAAEVLRQPNTRPGGLPAEERPMRRDDPTSHYVGCRWCGFRIPASSNPAYQPTCPQCEAIQSCTQIPTKLPTMPLISLFVNPNHTVYAEFVFAPPVPGRIDLSPVWRFTLPASACTVFEQHPMGKQAPPVAGTPGKNVKT